MDSGYYFSFIYNQMYIREMMEKGYRPANPETEAALQAKGIMAHTVRI